MRMMLSLVFIFGFANSLFAQVAKAAKATPYEFVGACSWGPKAFHGDEFCEHQKGNALAMFYRNISTGNIFVTNEIVHVDINFCRAFSNDPGNVPLIEATSSGSNISWSEKSDGFDSNVTILKDQVNEVQASTNSRNFKQSEHGQIPMIIYAPCYLVQTL